MGTTTTNEPWASLEEVAAYLGVNKDTVRNWIKKNRHSSAKNWSTVEIQVV